MYVCVCINLFGLVWFVEFYGISTFVGYLMPNPFLCFGLVWFVEFYGISTFVGYLTSILFLWFGLVC